MTFEPKTNQLSQKLTIKSLIESWECITLQCPSLLLHAERVSWMYQSRNKHENCENRIINRGNNTVFLTQKVVKIKRYFYD